MRERQMSTGSRVKLRTCRRLVAHALPDELGAIDVQAAARQNHAPVEIHIRDW